MDILDTDLLPICDMDVFLFESYPYMRKSYPASLHFKISS